MEHFIDEKTVMHFFLKCLERDEIVFLQGNVHFIIQWKKYFLFHALKVLFSY